MSALESFCADLQIIRIDDQLARRAGELALGGYDAVHLDCALALDAEDAVLATWDAALGDAAHQTGRLLVNQR